MSSLAFTITFQNEDSTVGAATSCYTPRPDLPLHYFYHSSESKFEELARKNGTDRQIEFLRALKKISPEVYEKVEDYLDTVRLDLTEDQIKGLMKA